MPEHVSTAHLDESALLHLVDRSASPWEMDVWSKHALRCPECAARLETLRRRTDRFSALLAEVELPADFAYPEPPRRRTWEARPVAAAPRPARWLRAAAVVLLLLAPLLAAEPVRAWVLDRAGGAWERVAALLGGGTAAEPAPAEVPAPPSAAETGSIISDVPEGDTYRVEVESLQAAGTLVLRAAPGREASLEVRGGSGEELPLVLPGRGFRIQNTRESTASYTVVLPERLARVQVRIGGSFSRSFDPGRMGAETTLSLRGPSPE